MVDSCNNFKKHDDGGARTLVLSEKGADKSEEAKLEQSDVAWVEKPGADGLLIYEQLRKFSRPLTFSHANSSASWRQYVMLYSW